MYKKGDRVRYTKYGKQATGTVDLDQYTDVVWVRRDDGDIEWMHAESLRPALEKENDSR